MKKLMLLFIENENDLLNLNDIIRLSEEIKKQETVVKIILVSNKGNVELATFIDVFNKLIGIDIVDFGISNSSSSIVYIKKVKRLKEHNIKNKTVESFNYMVQSLIDIYNNYYNIDSIYYISNDNSLYNKLKINNISYKNIDNSLYSIIFGLKED